MRSVATLHDEIVLSCPLDLNLMWIQQAREIKLPEANRFERV